MNGSVREQPSLKPAQRPKAVREEARALSELFDHAIRCWHLCAFVEGLNSAQWAALRFFVKDITTDRTAVGLARYQGISRASANDTVRALVRKGALTRVRSLVDARRHEVQITGLGRELLDRDPLKRLEEALMQLTSTGRRDLAAALLLVLRSAVSEKGAPELTGVKWLEQDAIRPEGAGRGKRGDRR